MAYYNAGKPAPPMVEAQDIPNGGQFIAANGGEPITKIGWNKDSPLTGCIKTRLSDGTASYICASAHVTPHEPQRIRECNACDWTGMESDCLWDWPAEDPFSRIRGNGVIGPLCPECRKTTAKKGIA